MDTDTSPTVAVEMLGHSFTPSLPAANSIRWAANAFAVDAAVSALFPRVMTRRGKSADIPSAWAARGGALARHSTRPDLAAGACHPGSLPPPLYFKSFMRAPWIQLPLRTAPRLTDQTDRRNTLCFNTTMQTLLMMLICALIKLSAICAQDKWRTCTSTPPCVCHLCATVHLCSDTNLQKLPIIKQCPGL